MVRENWKSVAGYEGLYEVSDSGRVRSLDAVVKHKNGGKHLRKGKILQFGNVKGYRSVGLCRDGRMKTFSVHRLVATSFIAPPNGQIRHLDGNKLNNRPYNLCWGTAKENSADRDRHGTTARGAKTGVATKTEPQVRFIKFLHMLGYGPTAIGRLVGLNKARVHEVTSGILWKHVTL